jgi:cystathionine gamma-synthase/methionine-gamma-lyase
MTDLQKKSFATRAVHAGERAAVPDFTPVVTPIHPTVGYLYESMEDLDGVFATTRPGFVYPRYGSPTVAAFEAAVADLECGQAAFAFSSGMAALHVTLLAAGVSAGTAVVGALDLYGATYTLIKRLLAGLGVQPYLVDVADLATVESALAEAASSDRRPVALVVETISNPLLKVADLPALADLAHRYGAQFLVDNTFATPYLINPLAHGADFVIHSATKYLGGHGDVLAGVVVTSAENCSRLYELNKLIGSVLGPFEAWLALRGVKTLPLRIRQQFQNAARLAEWLAAHPRIGRVHYPGLPNSPGHSLASRLFGERGYGGVLSFEIAGGGRAEVFTFLEALRLCLPATTLGDIYSLVLYPPMSSHRSLSEAERRAVGIGEGLVRLSAGIEDVADLIADLDQALAKLP